MRTREKLLTAVAVLTVLGVAKLGQHLYRWQAHAPERASIAELEVRLEDVALRIVDSQIRAASLREELETLDAELEADRDRLDLFEADASDGALRVGASRGYRIALDQYNQNVVERNARFGAWRRTLEDNRLYVDSYNAIADSIRGHAERMGDPYYPIRSPAEIAVARGWGQRTAETGDSPSTN